MDRHQVSRFTLNDSRVDKKTRCVFSCTAGQLGTQGRPELRPAMNAAPGFGPCARWLRLWTSGDRGPTPRSQRCAGVAGRARFRMIRARGTERENGLLVRFATGTDAGCWARHTFYYTRTTDKSGFFVEVADSRRQAKGIKWTS